MNIIKFAGIWHNIRQNCRIIGSLNVDVIVFSESQSEKVTYKHIARISSKLPGWTTIRPGFQKATIRPEF